MAQLLLSWDCGDRLLSWGESYPTPLRLCNREGCSAGKLPLVGFFILPPPYRISVWRFSLFQSRFNYPYSDRAVKCFYMLLGLFRMMKGKQGHLSLPLSKIKLKNKECKKNLWLIRIYAMFCSVIPIIYHKCHSMKFNCSKAKPSKATVAPPTRWRLRDWCCPTLPPAVPCPYLYLLCIFNI